MKGFHAYVECRAHWGYFVLHYEVANEMGVNTWVGFAGTDQDAPVDGDFLVLDSELQPVLDFLRKDNIDIVAIHKHTTSEEPRYLFLHSRHRGPVVELPEAVKSALEKTAR
jgi:hypothetical protein